MDSNFLVLIFFCFSSVGFVLLSLLRYMSFNVYTTFEEIEIKEFNINVMLSSNNIMYYCCIDIAIKIVNTYEVIIKPKQIIKFCF